ncbi:MAG: methyltransferase domain-containing protein [Candidatus Krumholzibacteriota bacterium]|nr:methyltransferase domain-containing protein [Candidatus Krumholzibacteriota bacterium]
MVNLNIVTPTHNISFLRETYESLLKQTDRKWKWLIVLNSGAKNPEIQDDRVIVVEAPTDIPRNNVGAIKNYAFNLVDDGISLELDHDDLLTPNAVKLVKKAFEDDCVGIVYSDFADFIDESWRPHRNSEKNGWLYRQEEFYGKKFDVCRAFKLTAQSISLVYFAPIHIRAWKTKLYKEVDGHNPNLIVAADHELLCKLYLKAKFKYIPKCLYLHREHSKNTYKQNLDIMNDITYSIYDEYIDLLIDRWCSINNYKKLDICCGNSPNKGYIGMDISQGDIISDLNCNFPLKDNSVAVVKATDALEHLKDPVHTMNEIYRILIHGGWLISDTPSTDGRGAFQDPTHCSFWNYNSFLYYTNKMFSKYVPNIDCRFQSMRLYNYFPSEYHKKLNIPYIKSHLVAVKNGIRLPGEIKI